MKALEDEGAACAKKPTDDLNGGAATNKTKAGTKRKIASADDQDELTAPASKKGKAASKKGITEFLPKPVKSVSDAKSPVLMKKEESEVEKGFAHKDEGGMSTAGFNPSDELDPIDEESDGADPDSPEED